MRGQKQDTRIAKWICHTTSYTKIIIRLRATDAEHNIPIFKSIIPAVHTIQDTTILLSLRHHSTVGTSTKVNREEARRYKAGIEALQAVWPMFV